MAKKLIGIIWISCLSLLLASCSEEKAALSQMSTAQKNIQVCLTKLNKLQHFESTVQEDWEKTLLQQSMKDFANKQGKVFENVKSRQELISAIQTEEKSLKKAIRKFSRSKLTAVDQKSHQQAIEQVIEADDLLATYLSDYKANLALEESLYQSIGQKNTSYKSIKKDLDKINLKAKNNQVLLEKISTIFEQTRPHIANLQAQLDFISRNHSK